MPRTGSKHSFKNTCPDTVHQSAAYLCLVIKSKKLRGYGPRATAHELLLAGRNLGGEFDDIHTKSTIKRHHIVALHTRNRKGQFYPHLHVLYWHSKGNEYWRSISELLRSGGYKYQWAVVRDFALISSYLQEKEHQQVLNFTTGAYQYAGPTGQLPSTEHVISDQDGEERGLQEESDGRAELADSGWVCPGQADSSDSDSDSASVGSSIGGKRKSGFSSSERERKNMVFTKAIRTIQPTSLSLFKKGICTNPEFAYLRKYMLDKNFPQEFAVAHQEVCFQVQDKTWEDCLQMVNMEIDIFDQYYTPNESVYWIKEFLIYNNINIEEFITNCHNVINRRITKMNSIQFHGPPNSFKTVIMTSLAESCIFPFVNNQLNGKTSQFGLSGAVDKRIAFLDEIVVDQMWQEKFLLLLGGMPCETDVKYEQPQTVERIPILLCFNKGNMPLNNKQKHSVIHKCCKTCILLMCLLFIGML